MDDDDDDDVVGRKLYGVMCRPTQRVTKMSNNQNRTSRKRVSDFDGRRADIGVDVSDEESEPLLLVAR